MKVLRHIPFGPLHIPSAVAAIGVFDGVHRGHRAILRKAVQRAQAVGGKAVAITFDPHPLWVLRPTHRLSLLIGLEERLRRLAKCGIAWTWVIPFTRSFSHLSPKEFVQRFLVERLKVREVVVGSDFRFGWGRSGSVETLIQLGRRYGFATHAVLPQIQGGSKLSSDRIRRWIAQGKLDDARKALGAPVTVMGRVVAGDKRGRRLGFPTANLEIDVGVCPPRGVYAVWVRVGKSRRWHPGMANIGFRPTVLKRSHSAQPTVEVHLFDVKRSLYGKRLEVAWMAWLRAERRFPHMKALQRRLIQDAILAKRVLKKPPSLR